MGNKGIGMIKILGVDCRLSWLLGLLVLVLVCLTGGEARAQGRGQYVVRGCVVDVAQTPIAMASVRLMSVDTDKMIVGDVTGQDGAFRLVLESAPQSLRLEVRFVGYEPLERRISLRERNIDLGTLILKEDEQLLREVTVVGKATEVVVRGDTIEYNAGSYTVGEGDAVEALLKKLPGAEVSEAGDIVIKGKTVSKIMVDGKRFFENDPKVALKNLPADLVDKIQVLDRESDNARVTGFADGDEETIINLTVKKGKKKGLFGSAYLGGGTRQRYEGSGSINRFAEGNQWTLMAGMNNTNNTGFSDIGSDISQSDLMGLMGGGGRRGRGGTPMTEGQGGITESALVGGNLAHTFSLSELSSGAFWGRTDKLRLVKGHTTHLLSEGNTVERAEVTERNKKHTVGVNLRWQWTPTKQTEVIITPQLNYGLTSGLYQAEASTEQETSAEQLNSQSLEQATEGRILRSELRAEANHRFSSGRTLALFSQWSYGMDDTEGQYRSVLDNARGVTKVDQSLRFGQSQWGMRSRLSYVEPLGCGYALQLQYQLTLDRSQSARDAYDLDLTASTYTLPNASYSYRQQSLFLAHRVGLAIKKAGKGYDITAGLNLDPSSLRTQTARGGQEVYLEREVLNYSPTLRIKYKPSAALDLGLDYRGRSFQPTSQQLSPVEDVTSQTVVYEGNPDLLPGYRHNLFGRLSLFDAPGQSSLMLFANLQYVQNDIVAYSTYTPHLGTRRISYTNVDGNGRIGVGGFFSRPILGKALSLRIGTQNMLSRQIGFVEGRQSVAHILRLSESLTLAYRRGIVDTSLKGSWSYYTLRGTASNVQGRTTHDYQIDWDNKLTLGAWSLEVNAGYRTSTGYLLGYDRDQLLVNTALSFSFFKDRAATLRLKVYDLLAQQQSITRSASALAISTEETNMLGRYAMLHFIYRFNQLGAREARDAARPASEPSYHRGRSML